MSTVQEKKRDLRVLLIEDNPGDADLIREAVEEEQQRPISLHVCSTLSEGITTTRTMTWDAILLDLGLPDSQGIGTFTSLQAVAKRTPIIILTGHDDLEMADTCLSLGAHDYLVKGRVENYLARAIHNTVTRSAVQQALTESYENIRRMVSENHDAIIVLDAANAVKFANKTAEQLFADRVSIGSNFGLSIESEGRQDVEIVSVNGSKIFVDSQIGDSVWYGEPVRVMTFRDVTKQKLADEARLFEMQRAQQYLDIAGVIIVALDREGIVTMINEKGCEVLGYDDAEVVGKSWFDSFIPQGFNDQIQSVARDLLVGIQEELIYENSILTRSGEERLISWHNTVIKNSDGMITGLLSSGEDITARRRAEVALQENEKKYRTLFQLMAQGVFVQDAAGILIDANPAAVEMFGLTRDEILGRTSFDPHWEVLDENGESLDGNLHPSMVALETGRDVTGQIVAIRNKRMDDWIWMEINAIPEFRPGESRPFQVMVTMHDITGRRNALEARQKALREMELLWKATRAVLFESTFDETAKAIFQVCAEHIGAPAGFFALLSEDGNHNVIHYLESGSLTCTVDPSIPMPVRGLRAEAYAQKRAVFDNTFRTSQHWDLMPDGHVELENVLFAPLILDDRAVGLIGLANKSGGFTKEDVAMAENYGEIAAIALREHQTKEILRERESFLNTLLEAIPIPVFFKDREGRYLGFNKAYETFFDARKENLIGKNAFDLYPRDLADVYHAKDLELFESGGTQQYDFQTVDTHGVRHDVVFNKAVFTDQRGSITGLIGAILDITERKKAEEDIRARGNLLNKVMDVLPVGLWLADANGKLFRSNAEGRRIWGAEPLVPMEQYGIFTARRLPSGEEVTSDDWALGRTIREGKAFLNELLEIDAFDGVTRTILNSTAPVLDDNGNVQAAVVVNVDITQQRQMEAANERMLAAIEQAGEMVVITDAKGDIEYVNPVFERITGYRREEVMGLNPRILQSGRHDAAFYGEMWSTISSGKTWHGRMINKRKDGTLFTEEATISPVVDRQGKIVNYVAVKDDISEHLRISEEKTAIEEQYRQNQKLESIGRLAGGIAHDFNNFLSVIMGYGEDLQDKLHPADPLHASAKAIVEAAERSATLTRQLLAFSRKQTLQPAVMDINDIVRNLEKMLQRLIGEDIELSTKLTKDPAFILIDAGQIEQVIMNLAVNARDAMPQGGRLTIETTTLDLDEQYVAHHDGLERGRYVLLSVCDSGCGMDAETRSHVFEPFYTTKEKGKGTGLGLSTVYGIIKQSSGHIHVYSEVGMGTTFNLYFPLTESRPDTQTTVKAKAEIPRMDATILVVEDETALRMLFQRMLESLKYKVTVAANGGEALLLVEEKGLRPDLLLTDVIMPGMSGGILADRLKKTLPDLIVLFMSGYTDNEIADHGVLDAGLPFIQKPFNLSDLKALIASLLQKGSKG